MATSKSTIEYIEDQLSGLTGVRSRKMFGEYALYVNDKVVGLVCDDMLFVKITEAGKRFIGERYQEGFPYPGAKPAMVVEPEYLEDRLWLEELVRITEQSLPMPKTKKK